MLTEKELVELQKEEIENMEDDNIVNDIAYYLYAHAEENSLIENLIKQLNNSVSHVGGGYSIDTEGHSHRIEKLSRKGVEYIIKCLRQYAKIQKIVEEYSKNDQYADIPKYFIKILDIFGESEDK